MRTPTQIKPPENWQDFETLCKKLWGEIWNCSDTIKKNGRSGQVQNGVDVSGAPDNGIEYYGIQCKGKDNYTKSQLTETEIDTEIAKAQSFKPQLKRFYFATTAVKDAKIEEYIRLKNVESQTKGGFSIDVYSWEDIVDLLKENRNSYNWYINDCQYVDNSDVQLILNGLEGKELNITPQFTLFYKRRAPVNTNKPQPELNRSIFGMTSLDIAIASFPKPSTATPIVCNVDHNTYKDLTWTKIDVVIYNSGSTVINDYHIDFEFLSNKNFELDDDYGYKSIISKGLINNIMVKRNHGISICDSRIKFHPEKARLVQDESRLFTFHIQTGQDECELDVKWILRAENFKKEGNLKIISKPMFEDKETGEPLDINYYDLDDCTIESKKVIKK